MTAIAVVHARPDREFIDTLLAPLPVFGIDSWVPIEIGGTGAVAAFEAGVPAAVLVLSKDTLSAAGRGVMLSVLATTTTPVVVVTSGLGVDAVPTPLVNRPAIIWPAADASEAERLAAGQSLVDLLPQVPPGADRDEQGGVLIPWPRDIFSTLLARAAERRDFDRGKALIAALSRHVERAGEPYPGDAAARDLGSLRSQRLFILMRLYAEVVLRSGTSHLRVRRQYGQALIELGEFDRALSILDGVVKDAPPTDNEAYEARGLRGRLFKQQYVNNPEASAAGEWINRAIEEYWSVFRENSKHTWHGVNAATLIVRAARDGIAGAPDAEQAHRIAAEVVGVLTERRRCKEDQGKVLDEWDCASIVEARIIVGDITGANQALDTYLSHPRMKAFEVSSTYRQFSEVLQLEGDERCRPLVERLWAGVKRHRMRGGFSEGVPQRMLLHVSDPEWPADVPEMSVYSRLGTVLSVSGSERTLKTLMNDPRVVAIEESRTLQKGVGQDCERSVPFIRVAESYTTLAETFGETGDGALIAVIDNGIDLLHEAFLDANGASRVIGVWDQTDGTGPAPEGFSGGTYHDAAKIAGYLAAKQVPAPLTRNEGVPGGHGTHVASIAAGRKTLHFAGGVAPDAKLLVVIPSSDQPTGYSDAHIAALSFIDRTATTVGVPVVVNVSQGMNAGAHDGLSGLEAAFDQFSGNGRNKPGRVVVKSAGNEGDKAGHAEIPLGPGGGEILRWRCTSNPAFRDRQRLELWWDSADTYRFRLRSPNGQWSETVEDAAAETKGRLGSGAKFEMILTKSHADNGASLLAIDFGDSTGVVADGEWALDIAAVEVMSNTPIHAWFERHGAPPVFLNRYAPGMTLSVPGTALHVITVGAIDASAPVVTGQPSRPVYPGPFSSAGPTRDNRRKPDVAAPGVNVQAAKSGTFNEAVAMDGTSMAAPHVTGAVALLLSRIAKSGRPWPTTSQVATLVRHTTRDYKGIWNDVQGFGVIDVTRLFATSHTITPPKAE